MKRSTSFLDGEKLQITAEWGWVYLEIDGMPPTRFVFKSENARRIAKELLEKADQADEDYERGKVEDDENK